MLPVPAAETQDARTEARLLLRRWLAVGEEAVLADIDALGRQAVRAAADASGRLDRGVSAAQAAEHSLGQLQALAAQLDAPARPARRSLFGRRTEPADTPSLGMEALIEMLDRARDDVAHALISLETDRKKLRAANAALETVLALIRACAAAIDAAARELAVERPDRAAFLRESAAARLLAREQDVLTQAAVTHQGVLTFDLIADSHNALAQALGRARETTIAALRTARAARQAVAGSAAIAEQAAALARTAEAAEAAPAGRGDLQRVLDDAILQARRAIAAAEDRASL